MAEANLNYHRHLDDIVAKDLAYVAKKDAQYNASWKRRGGVGAWFTIVRPWDRLENMTAYPRTVTHKGVTSTAAPYNIFEVIGNEGLEGPDGSAIACVRDLRRYLLLLEAEMTERLEPEEEPGVSKNDLFSFRYGTSIRAGMDMAAPGGDRTVLHNRDGSRAEDVTGMNYDEIERRMIAWAQERDAGSDIYGQIAKECGVERDVVKRYLYLKVYGMADRERAGDDGALHSYVDPAPHVMRGPPRSEDQEGWRNVGNVFQLEHRISPETWAKMPTHVRGLYIPVYAAPLPLEVLKRTVKMETDEQGDIIYCSDEPSDNMAAFPRAYWLDASSIPPEERDRWPTHQPEQNATEWAGLMEFRQLYTWHPGQNKFIIRDKHRAWAGIE
jgi:hypothetical protein